LNFKFEQASRQNFVYPKKNLILKDQNSVLQAKNWQNQGKINVFQNKTQIWGENLFVQ